MCFDTRVGNDVHLPFIGGVYLNELKCQATIYAEDDYLMGSVEGIVSTDFEVCLVGGWEANLAGKSAPIHGLSTSFIASHNRVSTNQVTLLSFSFLNRQRSAR